MTWLIVNNYALDGYHAKAGLITTAHVRVVSVVLVTAQLLINHALALESTRGHK